MNLLRTLALRVRDAFLRALCWAVVAGMAFWAATQWAPMLNADHFAHLTNTAIIQTETGWMVVGENS